MYGTLTGRLEGPSGGFCVVADAGLQMMQTNELLGGIVNRRKKKNRCCHSEIILALYISIVFSMF